MYTIIMHDWDTGCFIGSREFDNEPDARAFGERESLEWGIPYRLFHDDVEITDDV